VAQVCGAWQVGKSYLCL